MEHILTQNDGSRPLSLEDGDYLVYDLGTLRPADRGRVVEFTLTLRDVLPDRRVALAVTLLERDAQEREYPRGIRTSVVPAHHESGTTEVAAPPIRFVLPEELDMAGDGTRQLSVRVDAHYIDRGGACRLRQLV